MSHYKAKQDKRTLRQQAYDRLKKMESYGDNKYADKKYDREHGTDITSRKIYSHNTFKTYKKHINYFLHWVRETHPEIRKLDKAQKYVSEWLQIRVENNLSAWFISKICQSILSVSIEEQIKIILSEIPETSFIYTTLRVFDGMAPETLYSVYANVHDGVPFRFTHPYIFIRFLFKFFKPSRRR